MFGFLKSKKADVFDHWYALVPSFNASIKEFYAAIEKELREKQAIASDISHVDFTEGGSQSAKHPCFRMRA